MDQIVFAVRKKIKEGQEVVEVDVESDDEKTLTQTLLMQKLQHCEQLERLSIKFSDASTFLALLKRVRRFRAHLHREDMLSR